jgi:hypothetical protein
MIFDKICMSAFVGIPLDIVLRDYGLETSTRSSRLLAARSRPTSQPSAPRY